MESRTLIPLRAPQRATTGLGARLRQLRVAAGLTQSELAGDRFSKEYVSQIERGKTRPTQETLSWIGERLGVDVSYLETGQSWDEYAGVEAAIARAEAAVEGQQFDDALEALAGIQFSPEARELEFRALLAEAWARMQLAELSCTRPPGPCARAFRAARVLRRGASRRLLPHGHLPVQAHVVNTAQNLLSEALELADRSGIPCDRLRSHILEWRSRCSRRQRDFEAAREDIERALELAERLDDPLSVAHIAFPASLVAERDGHWLRPHARRARERAVRGTRRPPRTSVACSTTWAGSTICSASRTTPSRTSSAPSRSRSRSAAIPTRPRRCHRWRRCISAPATGISPKSRRATRSSPRRPPRLSRRDRQRADRPRSRLARAGTARRSRDGVRRGRAQPVTAFLCQPSCSCLDGPGRPRIASR